MKVPAVLAVAATALLTLSACGSNSTTASDAAPQAGAPGAHAGLTAKVGSTATPGGPMTATVAGHPVYTFSGDQSPGDVHGEGLPPYSGRGY